MDAELEKLVESGKLTSKGAEELDQLHPGAFCLHKSWGFGRIAEWNLLLNQIVIDFSGKKGHPMQLQYAADNLVAIPPGTFPGPQSGRSSGQSSEWPARTRRGWFAISWRASGGKATVQQISEWMIGDIFTEAGMETLVGIDQETAEKRGHFLVPAKKNEPVELRSAPGFALGPTACRFPASPPAEGTIRRPGTNHPVASKNSIIRPRNCNRS